MEAAAPPGKHYGGDSGQQGRVERPGRFIPLLSLGLYIWWSNLEDLSPGQQRQAVEAVAFFIRLSCGPSSGVADASPAYFIAIAQR